jgi:hypothetical protein
MELASECAEGDWEYIDRHGEPEAWAAKQGPHLIEAFLARYGERLRALYAEHVEMMADREREAG